MAKEIVINTGKDATRIALLENGELAELHIETDEHERTIGNICYGKVKKVMPNIRAAFVDIGQKQDAFLHYSDLTDNLPQLLTFLQSPNPEIGSFRITPDVRVARKKRRRQLRRRSLLQAAQEAIRDAVHHLIDVRRFPIRPPRRKKRNGNGKSQKPAPALPKYNRLEEYLQRDQNLLVKITKEPISNKGSRVSTDISLAGRFLVLVPLADYVAVSKKIGSYKERRRLRALARSLVPDGFGVIVRTVAEGKSARILDTDLRLLVEKWRRIEEQLQGNPKPPITVHEDVNMVSSVIRDLFSDEFERIVVDDPKVYRNVKTYVQAVAPHMANAVKLHQDKQPVFEATGIAATVREAFESRVSLPGGGYLFIERTEAMHVVDVNSGRAGRGLSQEENAIRVNLEAARVIARQIRLRDLGGIIVVDFIDLRDERNRKKIYDELRKEFRKDRAVTKLLPMSDFGLIEITRQRLRPSIGVYGQAEDAVEEEIAEAVPQQRRQDERPPEKQSGRQPQQRNDSPPNGQGQREGQRGRNEPKAQAPVKSPSKVPPVEAAPVVAEAGASEEEKQGRRGRGRGRDRRRDDPEAFVDKMKAWVQRYREAGNRGALVLRVHPFTAAFLARTFPNATTRWSFRYLVRIRVEEDPQIGPFSFRFHDAATGEELTQRPHPEAESEDLRSAPLLSPTVG